MDADREDPTASQAYHLMSDALAQIVHLNKSLVEVSYPGLRNALEAFLNK
jgi:hypothetical protein